MEPLSDSEQKNDRPVTRTELQNAIRAFCAQCMGNQPSLVTSCPSENHCPLWPVRKPGGPRWQVKREISDEQRERLTEQLAKGRESQARNQGAL